MLNNRVLTHPLKQWYFNGMEQKKKAATSRKHNPNIVRNEIRFPKAVWEDVIRSAKENHRSRNGEVIHILQKHFDQKRKLEEGGKT